MKNFKIYAKFSTIVKIFKNYSNFKYANFRAEDFMEQMSMELTKENSNAN